MTERVPTHVEGAIKADLRPVQALPPPGRRAIGLAPVAAMTIVAVPLIFAVRHDAPALGWALTWGVSAVQAVFALGLIALALRDAVPGRTLTTSAALSAASAVLGFSIAATFRTWQASPTSIRPESVVWIGTVCFVGTIVFAFPLLAAAAAMAARAFAVRPWSTGALYGLGAGLGADAGWRLSCGYSDPLHVWPTHTAGVLATMLVGVAAASLIGRGR